MKRIILIRLSHLGDVILTEPVARSIKAAYPDARIDFLTREIYRDAVSLFSGAGSVLTLQVPGRDQSLFAFTRAIKEMCKPRYDLLIDLHGNLRSCWAGFRIEADMKERYRKNWRARRRAVRKKIHAAGPHTVDLYLRVLEKVGIPAVSRVPMITISEDAQDRILEDCRLLRGEYCVFAVGASHPTKHYPIAQWVRLAEHITVELGVKVVIVESENYGYLNLFDDLRESGRLEVLTGLGLPVLAGLLASALLTVSNDSGIMHLSAAVSRPTIGLFGPTHPSLGFYPLGERCRAVTTDESCSPCSRHGASPCYRDDRYCFTKMNAEMIMGHVREVLDHESTRA